MFAANYNFCRKCCCSCSSGFALSAAAVLLTLSAITLCSKNLSLCDVKPNLKWTDVPASSTLAPRVLVWGFVAHRGDGRAGHRRRRARDGRRRGDRGGGRRRSLVAAKVLLDRGLELVQHVLVLLGRGCGLLHAQDRKRSHMPPSVCAKHCQKALRAQPSAHSMGYYRKLCWHLPLA